MSLDMVYLSNLILKNNLNLIKDFFKEDREITKEINSCFISACRLGYLDIAKYLLTFQETDVNYNYGTSLNEAILNNNKNIINYLINETDINYSLGDGFIISLLWKSKRLDTIKYLFREFDFYAECINESWIRRNIPEDEFTKFKQFYVTEIF